MPVAANIIVDPAASVAGLPYYRPSHRAYTDRQWAMMVADCWAADLLTTVEILERSKIMQRYNKASLLLGKLIR